MKKASIDLPWVGEKGVAGCRAPLPVINQAVAERFLRRMKCGEPDACWPWPGYRTSGGYGAFSIGQRAVAAHRIAYVIANGSDGEGVVMHKCDNPPCCNPAHLALGTPQDNTRDAMAKGRFRGGQAVQAERTHCPRGHAYDEANTIHFRGHRKCRACERVRDRVRGPARKAKAKEARRCAQM